MENDKQNLIMSDHNIFNNIIYTPLSLALEILEERHSDKILMEKISNILNGDIPEILINRKCGVFARQVATPNIDTKRFVNLTKENNLETILFEYPEDKFASKNIFKHSLGQIRINNGINKNGEYMFEKVNIINLVKYDGHKLKEIVTTWDEPLLDFHRNLFKHYNMPEDIYFYDIGDWYHRNGGTAAKYYTNFLMLFVAHGILFENFLITKDAEGDFTRDIVLSSIENIYNITGLKPLIVPLAPIDTESEEYWISHDKSIKKLIKI